MCVLSNGGNMYGLQRALFFALVIALVVLGIFAIAPSIQVGPTRDRYGSYGPCDRNVGYQDRRDRGGRGRSEVSAVGTMPALHRADRTI